MDVQRNRSRRLLAAFATGLMVLAATASLTALAQESYPSKPIRIIVSFPPGGAVDNLIRTIQPGLTAQLGQPIVVENKPGGGAQIAAAALMTAPADGYTLLASEIGAFGINPTLYKNISYQPVRDFEGVSMLVRTPMVMYGSTTGKINSVKALKDGLAAGDKVNYGSFGAGTAPHILGHLLARASPKASFVHVPYKGPQPATQAIMANEIDLLFDGVPGTLNMTRNGRGVALAVAAPERSPFLPDVPTTTELGYPQMVMDLWIGVVGRKGTPAPVVAKLHDAFEKAISNPETWKRFSDLGYSRVPMSAAQFNTFIKDEIERLRPTIVETGAVVD
ncbi:MAG: tripartite tricarboxylate transporter substrate binding protein [Nitrospira sp.]|nr:tripartite tricarboxylate transporter substrate binding protein [Nitrospira sp.]